MEKEIKVSVIVPVYNAEKYLEQCLNSIVSQTLKDIEIICVDDGSPDGSAAILRQYALKDDRITIIYQQNLYAGVARNNGLKAACGKYVAFIDSDDFLEENALETAVQTAEKREADITVFNGYVYDSVNKVDKVNPTFLIVDKLKGLEVFTYKDIPNDILTFTNSAVWNKIYRREFVREAGIWFQALQHTNDMYFSKMSLLKADRITYIDKPLIHYRKRHGGNLQDKKIANPYLYLDAFNKLYDDIVAASLYDEVRISLINYGLSMIEYEMRPYTRRTDCIEAFKTMLGSRGVVGSGMLDVEEDLIENDRNLHFFKGMQEAVAAHDRKTSVTLKNQTFDDYEILLRKACDSLTVSGNDDCDFVDELFVSYNEVMDLIKKIGDTDDYYKEQDTINSIARELLVKARKVYNRLNSWQKMFYLCYENPMRMEFRSLVVDYTDKVNQSKAMKKEFITAVKEKERLEGSREYKIGRMICRVPKGVKRVLSGKKENR